MKSGVSALRKKQGPLIITILTVILFSIGLYILNSVLWTGYASETLDTTKPALSSTLSLKDFASGESISLSSEDINKLLAHSLTKASTFGSINIESFRNTIKDNRLGFSALTKLHGVKLLLSTNGRLEYDGTSICYYPEYFKLGRLSLPKAFVYNQLKNYITIDSYKDKIFIDKNKLPINIESLKVENNILNVRLAKLSLNDVPPAPSNNNADNTASPSSPSAKATVPPQKPTTPVPSVKEQKSSSNQGSTSTDILKKTSSDLKKAYTSAKTTSEKQVIQAIQNTVTKLIQNENYEYENDAAVILSKYDKLTAAEQSDLRNVILSHVDLDALFKLASAFQLF
jgi:hypothetical protein